MLNMFLSLVDSLKTCPFMYTMCGILAITWAFQLFYRLSRNY